MRDGDVSPLLEFILAVLLGVGSGALCLAVLISLYRSSPWP